MKKRISESPRLLIILLLALYGLLTTGVTLWVLHDSLEHSYRLNYEDLEDDLKTIAPYLELRMNQGDKDCFAYLELVSSVQHEEREYSYVVRDKEGEVIAPSFAAGRTLKMKKVKQLDKTGTCWLADVWGDRCFIIIHPFPTRPLELIGVYDYDYIFGDREETAKDFIMVLVFLFLLLLAVSWFWIIPVVERVLERKRLAENELNEARDLQQKAVTTVFPKNSFFDSHAVLRPAREVGGDIYRFGMQDGKFQYVIGDVSDKGTTAALLMFTISSFIHSRTRGEVPVCELMKELNCLICDNSEYEMLCTLFLGHIDAETLKMEYCNAGHTRTLVNGDFLDQDSQQLAGLDRDYPYHTQTVQLHHGDRVLLYTDGVTEARGADRSFFGEKRLQEWMNGLDPAISSEAACQSLLDTLAAFRGNALQNDDIAIIYIKIV